MDYFKKISRYSSPDSRFFVDQATEPVPTYGVEHKSVAGAREDFACRGKRLRGSNEWFKVWSERVVENFDRIVWVTFSSL